MIYEIPANRRTDWSPGTIVGVPGGIPTDRTNVIDVTQSPYFADNTGVANASAVVQAAINDSASGDIIYLPAGTYRWDNQLYVNHFYDNRTVRGAGAATIIVLGPTARFGYFGYNDAYGWPNPSGSNTITAGSPSLDQNSDSVTIASSSGFAAGQIIRINVENSTTLPVVSLPTFPKLRGQLSIVTAVPDGTTVEFFPPLAADMSETAGIVNYASSVIRGFGVEDLYIDASGSSNSASIVEFEQAHGCWMKGIRVYKAANRAFRFGISVQCEMRKCHQDENQGSGPNHAGLWFGETTFTLIEDNIFYKMFAHIQVDERSVGNVFAYNFCEDSDDGGVMGASIDSNHGPHNSMNLYEGNVCSKFQSDGYYGGESEGTCFRNWFHATSPNTDSFGIACFLNRLTRNYNVVGNILGRSGELNQKYINVGQARYVDTSSSSVSIGTGAKVFVVSSGKGFADGVDAKIWSTADHNKFMIGHVTSYSGTTLIMDIYKSNGSGSAADWEIRAAIGTGYSDRYMISLGLPNLGNGGYTGMAEASAGLDQTWADWAAQQAASPGTGPNANGFQEYDFDVYNTIILKGNYNYATESIPSMESLAGDTLSDSLFRATKPDFFGNINWPPFDSTAVGTPSYTQIPAGYRFVNGNEDYLGGTSSPSFSPTPGTYGSAQNVEILCSTPSATIYYTTDGSTPTTGSAVYTTLIPVSSTTTIKAFATAVGLDDSSVSTGIFTIVSGAATLTINGTLTPSTIAFA